MPVDIKWNKSVVKQFDDAIAWIENDLPRAAEKIRKEFFQKINALLSQPEIHKPNKYRNNNDGSFRAFELYHFRVSYQYKSNEIRIIRIRHTRMNPLDY